jgi:CheY-like chemotaxis protein
LFDSGAPIDLVFTDLIMPCGVSGLQIARRARETSPTIKVLLTTGYSEELINAEDAREVRFRVLIRTALRFSPLAMHVNAKALADTLGGQPCELPFPSNAALIECTPGPVAGSKGVRRLADALDLSAFPLLAKAIESEVELNRLLLWVPIDNAEDERKAGLTLLAQKPRSYQVHDFKTTCDGRE